VYYKDYIPIKGFFLKSLRNANISFSIVDKEYDLLEPILHNNSYRLSVDIQDCPEEIREKLEKNGFKIREWGTYIIDLTKSEEELWSNIKKETRKIIKKTADLGCSFSICSSEKEYREYYDLFKKSRKDMNFTTQPYRIFKRQWDILHPKNYDVFIVRTKDGELLAGMGVVYTSDFMREIGAARSHEMSDVKAYPNDLLKWDIMKWGHNCGIKYYDLAGINPNPEIGSKDENIKKFKEKWGGQYYNWLFFEKTRKDSLSKKIFSGLENVYRRTHEKKHETKHSK